MSVTFGTSMPTRGVLATPEHLRTLAQRAEDLSFDHIWVSDHVIMPRQVESFYPYAADGVPTFLPDEPYFEDCPREATKELPEADRSPSDTLTHQESHPSWLAWQGLSLSGSRA